MKKKTLIIGAVVLALLLGGTYYFSQGSQLQGAFGKKEFTLSLNSSSRPAGVYLVSSIDNVLIFDVTAGKKDVTIPAGDTINVKFTSKGLDLNPSSTDLVYLKASGTTVASGSLSFGSISESKKSEATAKLVVTAPIIIPASNTKTFYVELNSASLMDEDAGEDDPLVVEVTVKGQTLTAPTLKY